MIGDPGEHVGKPSPGLMSLSLAVAIREYMVAARSPPRSDPANSHARRPKAIPHNARSTVLLVRQM